ncbi:MAG: hypothetical protein WCX61_01240 [Candidatus Peribacteraceae bacterium]
MDSIALVWVNFTTSLSVQIFVISTLVLLAGLSILVWSQAVHLKLLEPISLKKIEILHPHIPSLKVIVTIFLTAIALLIVAIQTMNGRPPFDGPYEFLYLAAIFVLTGSAAVLAELRWRGSRDVWFAFLIGTAVALLFLVLKYTIPQNRPVLSVILLLLLIASCVLSWIVMAPERSKRVPAMSLITFIMWLLLYF